MALKLAIVHINDVTGSIRVLIDYDLFENAQRSKFRRGKKHILKFLREQEADIKGRSVEITDIEGA
jgi:hypothetical protein